MMNLRTLFLPLAAVATLGLTACETGSDSAVSWAISSDTNNFGIMATLNQSYAINGEATMYFKNYGSVRIGQNNVGQSTITFALAQNAFGDLGLMRTCALPTGVAFPSIVSGCMLTSSIQNNSSLSANIYFSQQTDSDGTVRRLAGLAMGFKGISTSFGGLTLSQNYFNAQGLKYASLTIYGPVGTAPGGLFVVADINHFSTSIQSVPVDMLGGRTEIEVRGRNAYKYRTPEARQALAQQMLNNLEQAGVLRRR